MHLTPACVHAQNIHFSLQIHFAIHELNVWASACERFQEGDVVELLGCQLRYEAQEKTDLYREIFYTEHRGVSITVAHWRLSTCRFLKL